MTDQPTPPVISAPPVQEVIHHHVFPQVPFTFSHFIMLCLAVGVTWYFAHKDVPSQALNETATAQFQALSAKVDQMAGHVVTQSDLEAKVKEQMGPAFASAVSQQNGTLTNLAVAVGELRGQIANLGKPTAGARTDDGGFKNVLIPQNRPDAIPLTTVALTYDPKLPGLTGLTGSWNNRTEKFTANYAEWRTEHDGARSGLSLSREIYDGTVKVGEEKVPLTNGDTFFSTNAIAKTTPTPKYTFMFGSSFDNATGRKSFSSLVGQQLTPKWGLATGYVNNGWTVLSTYRFGPNQ